MKIIVEHDKCCGCGVCSNICPANAIRMAADKEGFLYPIIDSTKCLDCSKCQEICPIINIDSMQLLEHNIAVYAGYFDSDKKLKDSASGGAATAISESFIQQGGIVFGAEYCDNFKACRVNYAETIDQINKFKGSKYIQSYKADAFKKLKEFLDRGKKVLFIGLPCEVGAAKSFLHKDYERFYTAELICHGPTSQKVAEEYLTRLENANNSSLVDFTVRDKENGWVPFFLKATFKNGALYSEEFYNTDYGIAFAEFSRPSCYSCSYKGDRRVADITVGDFWGVTNDDLCWNKNGVSIICEHTDKGKQLFKNIPGFNVFDVEYEKAEKGNPRMICPKVDVGNQRGRFAEMFKNFGLADACRHITQEKNK